MTAFRLLLIVQLVLLTIYTVTVGIDHGWNFMNDYIAIVRQVAWPGQFAADFTMFLVLTGVWVAWRHHFSAGGLALGVLAMALGTGFLATYLLIQTFRQRGDMVRVLVGDRAQGAR